MKKTLWVMGALLFVLMGCNAESEKVEMKKMPTRFQSVNVNEAQLLQDGQAKMFCKVCGMNLPMFYKTNHASDVDGKKHQFCSIHCLVETMNSGKKIDQIQVVNNENLKFIDAKDAWYVVGSSKAGTMSKISKYAFAHKEKAQEFSKKFGGDVMNFDSTMALVQKGLKKESLMIQKKQEMMAKKGEMVYQKHCKATSQKFASVGEAKSYIQDSKSCGEVKGKQLQAIALYLYNR